MSTPLLKQPETLFAVVCENGAVTRDAGGLAADPDLGNVRESSPKGKRTFCGCKIHRIVRYNPGSFEEVEINP